MQHDSFTVKNKTCHIRRATIDDTDAIKRLILSSSIHVTSLHKQPGAMPQSHAATAPRKRLLPIRRILFKLSSFLLTADVHWRHFIVAETAEGTVIGCCQVKPHRCGIREVTTLCIDREWRNGIVVAKLGKFVIANTPHPLWGTCMDKHIAFQKRNGGVLVVDTHLMPPHLRRRQRLFNFFLRLAGKKSYLAVMKLKDQPPSH
jgi:hypothetical protein